MKVVADDGGGGGGSGVRRLLAWMQIETMGFQQVLYSLS